MIGGNDKPDKISYQIALLSLPNFIFHGELHYTQYYFIFTAKQKRKFNE